jgi:hypothetical protein
MEVTKNKEQEGNKPAIDPAIIEELMKDYQRPRRRFMGSGRASTQARNCSLCFAEPITLNLSRRWRKA